MTLNEITTMIAGRVGREMDMQYRQWLVPSIEAWRGRLIRNSLGKNGMERSQFVQSITIPMVYDNGFSKSAVVPGLLRFGPTPFDYLGSPDGSSPFRFNDPGTSPYIQTGIGGSFPYYEMVNGCVKVKGLVEQLRGDGIFDEPSKIMDWQCRSGGGGCDWWNMPYPMGSDILAMLKTATWEELGLPRETLPTTQKQDE